MSRIQSNVDRLLLLAFGLSSLSLLFMGKGTLWGLVGVIPLVMAIATFWPAHPVFLRHRH